MYNRFMANLKKGLVMVDVKEKDIVVFNHTDDAARFEVVEVGEKPMGGGDYVIKVREEGTRFALQSAWAAMVVAVVTR